MGGIIVSTVLSLVVVPSFFLIMDDLSRGLAWIFGRFVGKREKEDEVLENTELTRIINENARVISSLEERVQTIECERATPEAREAIKTRRPPANDLRGKPLAAE